MAAASPRTIALIDIENLAGTPTPTTEQCHQVRKCLEDIVAGAEPALVVVACSHIAAATVSYAWPHGRRLWRSGPNGADSALLDVIANEHLDVRFSRVIIASGDGIFTDAVAALAANGVRVEVVSRPDSLAKRLRMAAMCCHAVNDLEQNAGADVA